CWRGDPWAEVADEAWMADEMIAVGELRVRGEALRVDALIGVGRFEEATGAARALVAARPFDEEVRARLMRALYVSGRQRDALREFESARRLLVEEIGVEPGP